MTPHRGYLSLLQFAPDPLRSEAVNVGVVLLDAVEKRIDFRVEKDLDRAKRAFAWTDVDPWWVRRNIEGVWASILHQWNAGELQDAESLRAFGAAQGGTVRLTSPRAVPVRGFDASLDEAFERLVRVPTDDSDDSNDDIPLVARPLSEAFLKLRHSLKKVGIKQSFPLTGLGYSIRTDFDYRNGTANLVRLLHIGSSRPGGALKQAIALGGESVQVDKHLRIDDLKAKLIVVVAPESQSARAVEVESEIAKVARDFPQAEFIPSTEIPKFAERVLAEAK